MLSKRLKRLPLLVVFNKLKIYSEHVYVSVGVGLGHWETEPPEAS